MEQMPQVVTTTALLVIAFANPAFAYVGPGLGLGTIGVVVGLVLSVFLAVFAVAWYPVKRILKKLSRRNVSGKSVSKRS